MSLLNEPTLQAINEYIKYISLQQTQLNDAEATKKKYQEEFYNKEDMQDIKIVEATTKAGFKRNSFIYDFMSSMRQKINDPLGVRAKKRKEISQR